MNKIKYWTIHNHLSLKKYINAERRGHNNINYLTEFLPYLHIIHVNDADDGEYT